MAFPPFCLFFSTIIYWKTHRGQKRGSFSHITQQNQWNKLMEWVSDEIAQELMETRSLPRGNQGTNSKPADSLCFFLRSHEIRLWFCSCSFSHQRAGTSAFSGGNFVVPPPGSWKHAGQLTVWAMRCRSCWQRCHNPWEEHKTYRESGRTNVAKTCKPLPSPCSPPPGFTITWTSLMVRPITEFIWKASCKRQQKSVID